MWSWLDSGIGLGKLLRVRLADEGELGHEVVPEERQHLGLQAIIGQLFHVHVMVREAVMFEGQVGGVAPAVHLTGQEGDALGGGRFAHEGREVGRQRGERQLVDDTVTFIVPREGERGRRFGGMRGERVRKQLVFSSV